MSVDPLRDPTLPPPEQMPTPTLWRNSAFQRVWAAATVSIFGSLVTRVALPFVAIVTLNADAVGVSLVRAMELIAGLGIGLLAGAWVDRLRRRPVMIWADLGRAALLGLIPIAVWGGFLTLPLLLLVALLMAVLTSFFDAADQAYLPSVVPRRDLVRANGALAASSSVSEFAAFGSAGFLVQILTAPIAVLVDAVSFLGSALLLATIRTEEPPPPPKEDREGVLSEIAVGVRLLSGNPILRATTFASMAMAAMWGIYGAIWFLFAIEELGLDAAAIGVVAAVGGVSSLFGALITPRVTKRFGVGPLVVVSVLVASIGAFFVPLAPIGAPLITMAFLIGNQLVTDPALTAYHITDTSIRQSIVDDRQLGRVNATVRVAVLLTQLVATLVAGVLALQIGLRTTLLIGPIISLLAVAFVWFSPVRHLRVVASGEPEIDAPGGTAG
jgi:MFS family permease